MREGLKVVDISQIVLTVALFGVIFLFFLFLYPYHLFYQEQTQLFLFTSDSFFAYIQKPAWLSRYVGDYLTQFYYLRGGGAFMLTSVFMLQFALVKAVFSKMKQRENGLLFSMLPIMAEWFLHTGFNYRLSLTIGFVLALLVFLLYAGLPKRGYAIMTGLLLSPLLYVFIGGHLLTFVLLVLVYELKRGYFSSWWYWLLLLFGAGLYPLLWREYYLLTTPQSFFYPADGIKPFLPAAIGIVCLIYCAFKQDWPAYRSLRNEYIVLVTVFILSLALPFVNANFTREKLLALDSEAYFGNWEDVLDKAESYELKHPVVAYYTNLALANHRSLPDRLLDFYQPFTDGLLLYAVPGKSHLDLLFSGEAYFFLGDMNMAQHAAMLGMISSADHRSSRLIKRLAEINLINGDTTATEKYLRILDATLFHNKWARGMWELIESREEDAWLVERRSRIPTYDTLRTSYDGLASLTMLVKSNPMNRDALDYLLCFHLLNKDVRSFMSAYDRWFPGQERAVPRLYAEALLIALASEKAASGKLDKYGIPAAVTSSFLAYTKAYEENPDREEPLQGGFEATYWYYYHFAQQKEQ